MCSGRNPLQAKPLRRVVAGARQWEPMTASRDNPVAASARGLAQFAQAIVSPTFPLVLISLCAVSYLLASSLHSPELGLWA